jgi:hypothetical protein
MKREEEKRRRRKGTRLLVRKRDEGMDRGCVTWMR